jgi:hypothetical protein
MKRLLRIFALLMAASMLIWLVGCGGDDDDDDNDNDAGPVPTVVSASITAGASIAGNTTITFTMNKALASANVTGAAGTTTISGTSVIFTPSPAMSGSVTLSVTGEDAGGQAIDPPYSITFTATEPDTTPPSLVGASCVPANGASGVDPAGITELVVKFSEALKSATVTSKDPDFNSTDTVAGDTLTITFLAYSLPNETPVSIGITAADPSGNSADVTYGFETMEKAQ